MIASDILESYISQFDDLSEIVKESNQRVIRVEPDELFSEYLNVFVKAYLVSACSILEAYVTDCGLACLTIYKHRVVAARTPHNLIQWEVVKDEKKKNERFGYFSISKNKKSIKEDISGNYFLTIALFKKFGIDLNSNLEFQGFKDVIVSTVAKRNAIVHHNDQASDLSLPDVIEKIEELKAYVRCLHDVISKFEASSEEELVAVESE